ncbi:COX15/CtaA family protein [Salinirubellus salinus]|uniref:COX15/CtaA family protein n=1 Tax=Salinirubellus salinus TaxID=1364945 RepID=A0A9E7R4B4_9EURY|nr:COX15/CtaA family protein [Salinirubellus salinus]UWM55610.1 COX15/CtaA family protein [Salinirubellus salinus]
MDRLTRRLAGLSAGLTFVLVLLGVYTAADGAGLTCAGRWPLCDGAVFGLFPANWPSFVEWFHRLWAMVTGFVVLGTTIRAFRQGVDRKVRYALAGATLVLPSQIVLGALTVTQYELLILLAHFVTAFTILTLLFAAATWAWDPVVDLRSRRETALLLVAVLFPVYVALSPRLVFVYSELVQVGFYAVGMTAYAALVATTLTSTGRVRSLAGGAAALLFAELVVGRQAYGGTGELLMLAGAVLAFVAVVVALVAVRRGSGPAVVRSGRAPSDD